MEKAYTVMNEFISDPKERALYEAAFKYKSDSVLIKLYQMNLV